MFVPHASPISPTFQNTVKPEGSSNGQGQIETDGSKTGGQGGYNSTGMSQNVTTTTAPPQKKETPPFSPFQNQIKTEGNMSNEKETGFIKPKGMLSGKSPNDDRTKSKSILSNVGPDMDIMKPTVEPVETDMIAEKPSDLLKCELVQLREVCKEYGIIPDGNKWALIGKLIHLFPADVVTDLDLHRFTTDQLRSVCEGLNISREGDLEDLANRIEKYHHQILCSQSKKKYLKMCALLQENFTDIAPSLPVTVADQYYRVIPLKPEEEDNPSYRWKHSSKQDIKIGDTTFKAEVRISVTLTPLKK